MADSGKNGSSQCSEDKTSTSHNPTSSDSGEAQDNCASSQDNGCLDDGASSLTDTESAQNGSSSSAGSDNQLMAESLPKSSADKASSANSPNKTSAPNSNGTTTPTSSGAVPKTTASTSTSPTASGAKPTKNSSTSPRTSTASTPQASGGTAVASNAGSMAVNMEQVSAVPKANRVHHSHRKNVLTAGRDGSGDRTALVDAYSHSSSHGVAGTSRSTRGHSRNHGHHRRENDVHNRRLREREPRDGSSGSGEHHRVRTRSRNEEETAAEPEGGTTGNATDAGVDAPQNSTSNSPSANSHRRTANSGVQQPSRPRSPSPVTEPLVEPVPADNQPGLADPVVPEEYVLPEATPPPPSGNPQNVPYNWQASKANLKERLAFIYNTETMADVHFIVGKGAQAQRIPTHKFILSVGSAVFDAMFNGGMANTSGEVELPDVEPAAFLALLRFLYTDEVQIGPETVMTTLYTAKKYAVPALEQACVEFLKRNLSSDNAFMLLTQARLFDEPQLAALCLETIDKNTNEALSAEGFTDIDLETLVAVLERDTLGIRECKLYKAVCRWAEAECVRQNLTANSENQRKVLGHALHLVRFPLMTVEEFAVGAAQSGLLEDSEVVKLFLHFTVNPKPMVDFPDTPRCCLTGKEQVLSRFCQIENRWGYSGTSDRIRFMVNRRIFVVGFGLYGSIHGPSEYAVNIQIIQTDNGKICGQNDTNFQSDGSTSTFRVMFKEPVEITANNSYTACATLKGPDSYYGTKGLRKVTHESVTSGKVTFQFTYAAGNNNGTSVEDGQLPEIIFYT